MKASIEVRDRVIIRRFSGEVTLEDELESWDDLFSKYPDLTWYKGFILNYLHADVARGAHNPDILHSYLLEHLDLMKEKKVAVVMDNGLIVNTIIIDHRIRELHLRPFVTEEAAFQWIVP